MPVWCTCLYNGSRGRVLVEIKSPLQQHCLILLPETAPNTVVKCGKQLWHAATPSIHYYSSTLTCQCYLVLSKICDSTQATIAQELLLLFLCFGELLDILSGMNEIIRLSVCLSIWQHSSSEQQFFWNNHRCHYSVTTSSSLSFFSLSPVSCVWRLFLQTAMKMWRWRRTTSSSALSKMGNCTFLLMFWN